MSGRMSLPIRFAYADPPYIGQSQKLYGKHKDYAGEVDHRELIDRLNSEFDGWALSLSVKSLQQILALCPDDVLVMSWIKPIAPPMGDKRIYSWEPVILRGGRRPPLPTRLHVTASPPQFTFRERPPEHIIGEKPEAFSRWLFQAAGLIPSDSFTDLFPGSGAVSKAWAGFCEDPTPALEVPLDRWLAGSSVKSARPSLAELETAGYCLCRKKGV